MSREFYPSHAWVHVESSGLLNPTIAAMLWGFELEYDIKYDLFPTLANPNILDFDFDKSILLGGVHQLKSLICHQKEYCNRLFSLEPVDYPDSLRPFFGRSITRGKRSDIDFEQGSLHAPLFVKAVEHKRFADVFESIEDMKNLPDDMEFWFCSFMRFVSEYRCYVLNGEIQAMRHYRGNWSIFPDATEIAQMVRAYEASGEALSAYSLDVGINEQGKTRLVEVNDALCLGNYGISPKLACEMFLARWRDVFVERERKEER